MPLTYLTELRESIKKLSEWESSGKAFGFIEDEVSNENPNYLYEFFCSIKILNDLRINHDIELISGNRGYKFPQSPGEKVDWARFLIKDKNSKEILFQFCLGVEIMISSSPETTFAADISLQLGSSPYQPNESHVVLIMDAKYKKNKSSKIRIDEIREFAQNVSDMLAPKINQSMLLFNKYQNLNANCLFTNGEVIDKHKQYCINHKMKQVGSFDCDGRNMYISG